MHLLSYMHVSMFITASTWILLHILWASIQDNQGDSFDTQNTLAALKLSQQRLFQAFGAQFFGLFESPVVQKNENLLMFLWSQAPDLSICGKSTSRRIFWCIEQLCRSKIGHSRGKNPWEKWICAGSGGNLENSVKVFSTIKTREGAWVQDFFGFGPRDTTHE